MKKRRKTSENVVTVHNSLRHFGTALRVITRLDHHDPIRPQPRVLTHSCISFARDLVYVSGPCQPDDSFCLPVALRVIGQIQWKSEAKARNSNSEVEIIPVLTEIIIDRYQPLMILNDVCATEAPPVVTSQQQDWAQTINEA